MIIMPEYRSGGAEVQFGMYIDHAEECGYKLDVIVTHRFGNNKVMPAKGEYENVRFYEINSESSFYSFLMKKNLNTRYDCCLIYFPKDLAFFDTLCKFNIKAIYSERNDGVEVVINSFFADVLRKCLLVTANSEYSANRIREKLGIDTVVVNNGITQKSLLEVNNNKHIKNILVPARIDGIKNQMRVLKFVARNREKNYRVNIAGTPSNKAYFLKCRHFVEDNSLEKEIRFLGQVDNMVKVYEEADVIVLPSLCEGTPNVVLESYLLGRPVVAMKIGVLEGVVDDRLLFDVGDECGIERCINVLESMSQDEYRSMIEKNRNKVLSEYSVDEMFRKYDDILGFTSTETVN